MIKKTLFLLLLVCSTLCQAQEIPAPFMPEIVSKFPNVRDIAISPDGKEIIFSAQSVMGTLSALISIKMEDDGWSEPKIVTFSGQYFDIEPFFSSDGLRLYFASNRPLSNSDNKPKDFDIWYVKRINSHSTWSNPINLGSPINTEHNEFYPSLASNGNLYFTLDNPELNRKDDIYFSEFKNGEYLKPIALSGAINSEGYEFNAFVAPNESYLIFTCYQRNDGFGSGDLYISYKLPTGKWDTAKNMGKIINSNKMDFCPFVDPKSKTLFFTSKLDNTKTFFNSSISMDTFMKELNKYDNGSSRLYSVTIKNFISN